MISVVVELMAAVRNPFPNKKRKNTFEINQGISLRELLLQIGFQEEELNLLVPIVNGKRTRNDHLPKNGDQIFITLPIGGG
ncbi:MAG: MoaD/ThiS family protein [Candidatus Hodarchaeales archaeon]|jgi:sulfur carrier protein ThiS